MTDRQPPRTILITGVSGQWGRRVARRLLCQPGLRVLGLDQRPPEDPEAGLDFIKADTRNPLLTDLLRVEQVDCVVHLAFRERQQRTEEDFESNVMGAMYLVGACADAGVQQVVIKSTTAVYGALPDNPMYVPETWPRKARSDYAWVRDALEIERFVEEFGAEYPDLRIAVLRFANIVDPDAVTPFTRLLSLPVMPTLLGFDPLLQLVDGEDVVAALTHAALTGYSGPVNVAAEGVVPLCKIAGMVGRPELPLCHLGVYWGQDLAAALHVGRRLLAWFPLEPDYLRFPWTADVTRMAQELDFAPVYSATAALQRYAAARRTQPFRRSPEMERFAGDHLQRVIRERQGRATAGQGATSPGNDEAGDDGRDG